MNVSRKWYWTLAAIVVLFLILLNGVKVQDHIAQAFGYTGTVPMFALDQMIRGYTPTQVFQVMTAYGEVGRRAYAFLLCTCDLVFPFLYGSFLFLSIRRVSAAAAISPGWATGLATFGFLAAGCDWLENISFLMLMRTYPAQSTAVAQLASWFTRMKFIFSGVSLATLAVIWIYRMIGPARQRGTTKLS